MFDVIIDSYLVRPIRGRTNYLWTGTLRCPFNFSSEQIRESLEEAVSYLFELFGVNALRGSRNRQSPIIQVNVM